MAKLNHYFPSSLITDHGKADVRCSSQCLENTWLGKAGLKDPLIAQLDKNFSVSLQQEQKEQQMTPESS